MVHNHPDPSLITDGRSPSPASLSRHCGRGLFPGCTSRASFAYPGPTTLEVQRWAGPDLDSPGKTQYCAIFLVPLSGLAPRAGQSTLSLF